MTQIKSTRQYGRLAIAFGLAATCIYLVMINITLEYIEALTGLLPFDMRPGGYSPEEAGTLLNALGADGNRYYLTRQIPLDLIYPALMALTLVSILKWLEAKHVARMLTKIGVWLSIGAAAADYLENAGIVMMISNWPEPSIYLVHAASTASIAKSGLTTLAVLSVIIGLIVGAYGKTLVWLKLTSSNC
ncbi:MAG: hypothetical protein AB8G77_23555 [Rhodothermales bacterium]